MGPTGPAGPLTRWFADLRLTDRPDVGGKCASLGELIGAGIEVPDGFAVTVEAFEAFRDLPASGGTLREQLRALVRGVDPGSAAALRDAHRRATELICSTPVPYGLRARIREDYAELCRRLGREDDLPVAVRSSAVAEDGDAASFAGQQETYLWVVGADSVVEHVRSCWASLYTPQAIAYRCALPEEEAARASRIAVGVQAMVDAEVAGVAFTVSPRTGDRSVVAINASWGLGHAVVSGEVTPDEYWVSKVGPRVRERTVAHKRTRCVVDPDAGHGVRTADVPEADRDRACLDDDRVLELAALAVRVERHYGSPQDIEWALTRPDGGRPGRFLLLQSRPETSWRTRKAQAARPGPAAGYLGVIQAASHRLAEG
jgi:pyruvate,water dikinase